MPSLREETKTAIEKGQSVNRRAVPRCKESSPKVTGLEDAESQGKKAIEEINGGSSNHSVNPTYFA